MWGNVAEYSSAEEMVEAYKARRQRLANASAKPEPKVVSFLPKRERDPVVARPKWTAPVVPEFTPKPQQVWFWSVSFRMGGTMTPDGAELQAPKIVHHKSWKQIVHECAEEAGLTSMDLFGPWRNPLIVRARHKAFWRLRNEKTMSYPDIGRRMGDRDHTTIMSGVKKHQSRIDRGEA